MSDWKAHTHWEQWVMDYVIMVQAFAEAAVFVGEF